MEEMHRTHKEPVWGWVSEIALIARAVQRRRPSRPLPIPMAGQPGTAVVRLERSTCP